MPGTTCTLDGTAFTYTITHPEGISESLTWSQVYRRTLNVAVRRHAAIGDRAVILAPRDSIILLLFWALCRGLTGNLHFGSARRRQR